MTSNGYVQQESYLGLEKELRRESALRESICAPYLVANRVQVSVQLLLDWVVLRSLCADGEYNRKQ